MPDSYLDDVVCVGSVALSRILTPRRGLIKQCPKQCPEACKYGPSEQDMLRLLTHTSCRWQGVPAPGLPYTAEPLALQACTGNTLFSHVEADAGTQVA